MRPIDADNLKAKMETTVMYGFDTYVACGVIDDEPTIDAEPVQHGHWVCKDIWIVCSNCNIALLRDYIERATVYPNGLPEYCPCCGAKMDGGGGAEDATN